MRVRVEQLDLVGAERTVRFRPGLNVITGPIASGKTTLIRLLRFLLGSSLGTLPPEPREMITAVGGSVVLGESRYSIVRPAVTTATAKVDLASDDDTWRLPASAAGLGETYSTWLLDRLSLPRLEVPSAPTKPDSETTPVSIRDYWLYTYISQKELGFEIFGHRDHFKNVKRKYVFDIVYGFYDVETAELQDRLRTVSGRLRHLSTQAELFRSFFEDTVLDNRAALEHELSTVQRELAHIEGDTIAIAQESDGLTGAAELQERVLKLEADMAQLRTSASAESAGVSNMRALIAQLESQSAKLTRAIVAGKHLTDIEFVLCPRCGSAIDDSRANAKDLCYLCLQMPTLDFSRDVLVKEQDAVDAQLTESQDLLHERRGRLEKLQDKLRETEDALDHARAELDFQTRAFVSERAKRIASAAEERSALRARERQLQEYLAVLSKLDGSEQQRAVLIVERDRLVRELEAVESAGSEVWSRVKYLEERFNEILDRLHPPAFGEEERSSIDTSTYLPIYRGRRYDTLSSPGLATLVGLAYALAQHTTALDLGLRLPSFLIVDGLSEHLGKEGLDPERLRAVYEYLIELSASVGDVFQVVVVDNELPDIARPFVQLELSETERLIPSRVLKQRKEEE